MMPVYHEIDIDTIEEDAELPSKTYKLDLESGRIQGTVDELDAVKQAITKILHTPRYKCLIYGTDYGTEIEDAVTVQDATQDYTRAVIPGFLKEALLVDTRIISVDDEMTIEFKEDMCHVTLSVETIFGSIVIDEVV